MKWNILTGDIIKKNNILDTLLKNRELNSESERNDFLNPNLKTVDFKSTNLSKQECDKAVGRIKKAIHNKESIVVFTDYDADGVTAGAILWETIFNLHGNVMPYVPHRTKEGYGMSKKAIDNINKKFNPALLITVDHGITAKENTEYAKSLGMDVIILDHHTVPDELPEPFALVHTTVMCAAGISWFFSNYLRSVHEEKDFDDLKGNYLDLAVIGTVADLVPLVGVNRVIAYHGLKKINQTKRVGLLSLIHESGLEGKEIDTYHIGHILAPRINAMGRLTHALDALRLLCTKNEEKAKELASILGETNTSRQELTSEHFEIAESLVNKEEDIIIIYHEEFNEGIIGLVAGRLVEKYNKPAIVISKKKDISKASARSIKGFNIVEFFREHRDLFIDIGGHPMAAGFTVESEKITFLTTTLQKKAKISMKNINKEKEVSIDAQINFGDIDMPLVGKINQLKPFGIGNPEPIFMSSTVLLTSKRQVGKNQNHLKAILFDKKSGKKIDTMGFGMGKLFDDLDITSNIDIAFRLGINEWQGERKLQLFLLDVKVI